MKKESLKNEIVSMLENAQDVHEFREYGELMVERHIKIGNFKATFVSAKDEENRRLSEEQVLKRAAQVNRQLRHFHASELNERSNSFQKAMAYIGEHRHLIPFFRFVDGWVRIHTDKSVQDAIRAYRIENKLPAEVISKYTGWGKVSYYELEDKAPDIYTVLSQLPYLPKAWHVV